MVTIFPLIINRINSCSNIFSVMDRDEKRISERKKSLKDCVISQEEINEFVNKIPNAIASSYYGIIFGFKSEEDSGDYSHIYSLYDGTKEGYLEKGDVNNQCTVSFKERRGLKEIKKLATKMKCNENDIRYIVKNDARVILKGLDGFYLSAFYPFF